MSLFIVDALVDHVLPFQIATIGSLNNSGGLDLSLVGSSVFFLLLFTMIDVGLYSSSLPDLGSRRMGGDRVIPGRTWSHREQLRDLVQPIVRYCADVLRRLSGWAKSIVAQ